MTAIEHAAERQRQAALGVTTPSWPQEETKDDVNDRTVAEDCPVTARLFS